MNDTTRTIVRFARYVSHLGVKDRAVALSRLVSRNDVVSIPAPSIRHPVLVRRSTSDVVTFEQVLVRAEYAFPELPANAEFIVDAGANVGYATIFFANRYPGARIVAIEPEQSNYELLVANVRPYPNVTPIRAALWSHETTLAIEDPDAEKWAVRVHEAKNGGPSVPATTIPALIRKAGVERIDLLKIDVEGAELELFDESVHAWLGKVGTLIIELHDRFRPGCSTAVFRATSRYAFNCSQRGDSMCLVAR